MKKNKIWKRAGAVILSTALLFGTLPTGVMAEKMVGQDTNEETAPARFPYFIFLHFMPLESYTHSCNS